MSTNRWMLRWGRFLRVKPICNAVFKLRFWYFVHVRRQVRDTNSHEHVLAHKYSYERVLGGRPSDRILKLIQPLSVIDRMTTESKVLAIGCRFETDLLYLVGYGFHPANVRGLDMISYSPWVDCGDMHKMNYPDSTWDAVLLGWTLAYSTEPQVAAREIIRVVRPGGLVAISVTCYPPAVMKAMQERGEMIGDPAARRQTVASILELFQPQIERVYFQHDVSDPNRQGPCMVIFAVKK